MRRLIGIAAAAALLSVAFAGPVAAHEPTCSDFGALGIEVHGQHVIRDYVMGGGLTSWPPKGAVGAIVGGSGAALPGGPGPAFHFANGFAPGASFCNSNANSPGFHVPG